MVRFNYTNIESEVLKMADKTKEKIFAERQDNYKQEKEQIIKKALKEHKEEKQNAGEEKE